MDTKYWVLVVVVAVTFFVAVLGLSRPNAVTSVVDKLGVAAGPTHTEKQEFLGGVEYKTLVATSSQGSQTVTAAQFRQWVNSGLVEFSPGLVAGATLTLPASSTMPDVLPLAGDRQEFCLKNATTTAGVVVTIAGGTGLSLNVASSSATALGSAVIRTGEVGCFTLVRGSATATTFDISALFTVFQ